MMEIALKPNFKLKKDLTFCTSANIDVKFVYLDISFTYTRRGIDQEPISKIVTVTDSFL
jgi:hypothetical protein